MLSSKKTLLTVHEQNVLDISRNLHIKAFEKFATNPSDFNTVIQALKILGESVHTMMAIVKPHLVNVIDAENDSTQSRFSFFKNRAHQKMLKQMEILNEAKDYKMRDVQSIISKCFANERRITGLSCDENFQRLRINNGPGREVGHGNTYKITFSDNTDLILTDLSAQSVAKAKTQFEAKLNELATENRMARRI